MNVELPQQPFTLENARAGGLSPDDVRGLVRARRVRRVLQGVYVDARVPDSVLLRAAALSRVVPQGSLVCRRTAAWLYGVDVMAVGAHLIVPPVEIVVPKGKTPPRRNGCHGYVASLAAHDVQLIHGIAVTTPLRTAADLVRWMSRTEAVVALDAMTHAGIVCLEELAAELPRWAGDRGAARGAEILTLAEARTESPGESRLRLRIMDAGFPRPEAQIEFFENGMLRYRLDLGYRERRKATEYDGEADHSSVEDRTHDQARRLWFAAQGWEVLPVGKAEVYGSGHALELAVGELLGLTPRFRRPIPGWG
jgi:hypothetical protein